MEMESVTSEDGPPPTHLVVMVNDILGSSILQTQSTIFLKEMEIVVVMESEVHA
ncbi:hypothetical protein MKW92_040130 [Papaver armeniacum]|nr:hypothetical protein MKW92_040130 [Papaver armeniacum]